MTDVNARLSRVRPGRGPDVNGARAGFAGLVGYCAGATDWRSAATAAAVWVALELGALSWRHRRALEDAAWQRRYDRSRPTR